MSRTVVHPCPKPPKRAKRGLTRAPMRKVSKRSAKSGGHLFYGPKYVDLDYRAWIQRQPCHVTRRCTGQWIERRDQWYRWRRAEVVAAHVKARGASGRDKENMIPLDAALHEEQHRLGWPGFCKKYGIGDRFAVAAAYEAQYRQETGA